MVTVSVSELTGAALDWAMAIVELQDPVVLENGAIAGSHIDGSGVIGYSPSTDWDQCGSLIEEYNIGFWGVPTKCGRGQWEAQMCHHDTEYSGKGETHLIAACRAILSLNLGQFVEIPQELLE